MGMTIDELVETAQKYNCMIVTKDMWNTALGNAHKLQKIEQLIAMDDENHRRTIKLCELKGVLEDGNDE